MATSSANLADRGRLFPPLFLPESGARVSLAPARVRAIPGPGPWAPVGDSPWVPEPCSLGVGKGQLPEDDSRSSSQSPGLAAGQAKTTGVPSSKVFSWRNWVPAGNTVPLQRSPCSLQLLWGRLLRFLSLLLTPRLCAQTQVAAGLARALRAGLRQLSACPGRGFPVTVLDLQGFGKSAKRAGFRGGRGLWLGKDRGSFCLSPWDRPAQGPSLCLSAKGRGRAHGSPMPAYPGQREPAEDTGYPWGATQDFNQSRGVAGKLPGRLSPGWRAGGSGAGGGRVG